jgi:hypothetical protein
LAWFATPPGIAALQYTGSALVGVLGSVAMVESIIDNGESNSKPGRRRRHRLPDYDPPNSSANNGPGTTTKIYGEDGWVELERNDGHQGDNVCSGQVFLATNL